jgi:hypothetical protein
MVFDFKQVLRWLGIALLALAIWLVWWSRPERQVRRAQHRLLAAIEARDYPALARLLAEDYRDRWENDKANVLRRCPQVFDQFVLLDVEGEIQQAEIQGDVGSVQQKIVVTGIGGGIAMYARDEINALKSPFTMQWRKRSWKPWDWELFSIEQPELRIPQE